TLNDLAIPLNKEALKDVNLPYYLTKTWKTLEEEAHQLNQLRNEIESEQKLLENELETIQTNINQLKQKLLPISELDKLKEQLFNYSHTSKQVNDLKQQSTDQNLKKKIGFGGITLVVALLIISIITTNTFFIISTILASGLLIGLYYVVNFFEQKNQALIDSLVDNQGDQLTKDEYLKIKSQVDKQDDYLIQLKYLENDYQKITREELQLSERYEMFVQREKMFNQKVLDEQKNYEFLTNIDPIHWPELLITLKKNNKKITREQLQMSESYEMFVKREKMFNQKVLDEQKHYEFLTNIDPIHWPELLITLKKLKEKESYQEEKEQRNKEIIESLNAYEMKLSKVLERLSLSNYQELTSRLETHKKAYDIINNYEATIQETIEEKKLLNKEIDYYQNEISALFELASVENEEDFYKTYYEY